MRKKGLIALIGLLSLFVFTAAMKESIPDVKDHMIRVHIRANSDEVADQELKIKIRDFVLESGLLESGRMLDKAAAAAYIEENREIIGEKVTEEVKRLGFSYRATVEYKNEFFPTKEYENLKLPAGRYDALIVNLGSGAGENWFCVMFPPVCTSSATKKAQSLDYLSENCGKGQMELITKDADEKADIKIKFKTVELLESAKEKLKSVFKG